MILGVDEVGRGPWAGPLVIGAVVLGDEPIEGLTDSKKLSAKKRQALDAIIREKASGYGLGWVHADELDKIGLSEALKLATIRAVEQVKVPYHEIIIDGTINFLKHTTKGRYVTTLAKGDALVPAISAASIIAKVARDTYMGEQDLIYPGYGFAGHVGYGTASHRAAIDRLGVTPLHRASFAPIAALLKQTTKAIGDEAETEAAAHLEAKGFTVIERNWRTRLCEIDIIAQKGSVLYFIEVKYRTGRGQGGGIAAITFTKRRQMEKAARLYLHAKGQDKTAARLVVMTLTPDGIENFLEIE